MPDVRETYKSWARKPFFFQVPLCRGIQGIRRKRIHNGFTTVLERICRLPSGSLPTEEGGGETVVLSVSKCKVTTIFPIITTNNRKIYDSSEENVL